MIKIVSLVENTSSSPKLKSKHGLCIYIETSKHKILFDLGPNGLFLENAKKLGVDIQAIDTVIISHGHSDHGGALANFMMVNSTAKIYIKESAFNRHYIKVLGIPFSTSIDNALRRKPQIVFAKDYEVIDDELSLFSNVTGRKIYSKANTKLFVKKNGRIVQDEFEHEQYLVITEENKKVMITGCSHNGIVNIVEKYAELHIGKTESLTCIIGGFHLFNPVTKKYESKQLISDIGDYLGKMESSFYTCHCTGEKAYQVLKERMGNQLNYLSVGTTIKI